MGESPEGGGVPGDVDPARSPTVGAACARGDGRRGGVRRGPQRATGTRRRALRGGKGGSRAFGRRPRGREEAVRGRSQTTLAIRLEGDSIQEREFGRGRRGRRTLGTRRGRGRRGGRGVTGHGDRANGKDRGGRSRGGDRRGGSTANRGSGSTPTSRRGWLERRIQPGADLLAECLPLELGQGRVRRVEDLEHVGKQNTLQSLHRAELRGQERCSALDKVGMEGGSELDPIDVAVGAALGGDDVGGEVGPIEEPPGTKDGGEVEDREVIGGGKGGRRGDVGGWSTG